MSIKRKIRKVLVKYIKNYTIHWYVYATLLYLSLIPVTVWLFPATTLTLSLILLLTGFTTSVGTLGSALLSLEQEEELKKENNDEF